jgi:hypothetical protein
MLSGGLYWMPLIIESHRFFLLILPVNDRVKKLSNHVCLFLSIVSLVKFFYQVYIHLKLLCCWGIDLSFIYLISIQLFQLFYSNCLHNISFPTLIFIKLHMYDSSCLVESLQLGLFYIHLDNFCFIIKVLRIFKLIIDMVEFKYTIFLSVLYFSHVFFVSFLFMSYTIFNYHLFHLYH